MKKDYNKIRKPLIITGIAYILSAIILFFFANIIISALTPQKVGQGIFSFYGGFMLKLQVSLYYSMLLTSPLIFYTMYTFLTIYCKQDQKRVFFPALLSGIIFSSACIATLIFVVPFTFNRLISFMSMISADRYQVHLMKGSFIMGLLISLPIFFYSLTKINIISNRFSRAKTRIGFIGSVYMAALLSPAQDITGLVIITIPILIFFFIGVIVSLFIKETAGSKRYEFKLFDPVIIFMGILLIIPLYSIGFIGVLIAAASLISAEYIIITVEGFRYNFTSGVHCLVIPFYAPIFALRNIDNLFDQKIYYRIIAAILIVQNIIAIVILVKTFVLR
ncbi:MAG: preprotein translocase subunit TatC [bacterium]|nr:preprotein translocase subunit TatC [bacterium]